MIKRRAITAGQKQAIKILLDGGNIINQGTSIHVRDAKLNPVSKLTSAGFYQIKDKLKIVKKSKKGWILKPAGVRKLHGNSSVYKMYLKHKTSHNGNN